MKSMVRRLMLSAAFVVGLVAPLAATWTTPAQASSSCGLSSGSDSWTGTVGGNTFVVSVVYNAGVTVVGTPPPFTSLPMTLVSGSGHTLTITATSTGMRQYEGDFTSTTDETCSCQNQRCDSGTTGCTTQNGMFCQVTNATTCVSGVCGGGSCSGGRCTGPANFTAKI